MTFPFGPSIVMKFSDFIRFFFLFFEYDFISGTLNLKAFQWQQRRQRWRRRKRWKRRQVTHHFYWWLLRLSLFINLFPFAECFQVFLFFSFFFFVFEFDFFFFRLGEEKNQIDVLSTVIFYFSKNASEIHIQRRDFVFVERKNVDNFLQKEKTTRVKSSCKTCVKLYEQCYIQVQKMLKCVLKCYEIVFSAHSNLIDGLFKHLKKSF